MINAKIYKKEHRVIASTDRVTASSGDTELINNVKLQ